MLYCNEFEQCKNILLKMLKLFRKINIFIALFHKFLVNNLILFHIL